MADETPTSRKLPPISPKQKANDADSSTLQRKRRRKKMPSAEDSDRESITSNMSARERRRSRENLNDLDKDRDYDSGSLQRRKKTRSSSRAKRSESKEPLTPQEKPLKAPKKPPRKKKPKMEETMESPSGMLSGRSAGSVRSQRKKKKGKKKSVPKDGEGEGSEGLPPELADLEDDIVSSARGVEEDGDADQATPAAPVLRSQPFGRLFIEQKSGFKSEDKEKVAKRFAEEQAMVVDDPGEPPSRTTIQFGLSTHRVFKTISLFCHGLLAGLALWQIIMVYRYSNLDIEHSQLLEYYSPLALPVQSAYYILLVISTLSVFDRYDIGRPTKKLLLRGLTGQSGAITCLFYMLGLMVSLSIAAIDDKIGLHRSQPELWADKEKAISDLNTWRILNLVRGVMAILGWMILSISPTTDRLTKNLESAEENIIDPIELSKIQNNGV